MNIWEKPGAAPIEAVQRLHQPRVTPAINSTMGTAHLSQSKPWKSRRSAAFFYGAGRVVTFARRTSALGLRSLLLAADT